MLPVPPAAYKATRKERCPLALPCERFPDAAKLRCVREDTHDGVCRLIDGLPLTAQAVPPAARYRAMGLTIPAYLDALPEMGVLWQLRRRRRVMIAGVFVASAVLALAVLELARAAGWVR